MWWRSLGHFVVDSWYGPAHELEIHSIDGVLGITFAPDIGLSSRLGFDSGQSEIPAGTDRVTFYNRLPTFNRFGFGFYVGQTVGKPRGGWRFGGRSLVIIHVPFWLISLLFCCPSALLIWREIQALRRVRMGLCKVCGYDLRATPDRCPECGTMVQKIVAVEGIQG